MKYIFSGTLPQDAPTYIERKADKELYQQLKANQFCYVFNSRKMGKSSLRVRVMSRLEAEGFACAAIDLSLDEVQLATPEQWYFGIIYNLTEDLELDLDLDDWWDKQPSLSPLAKLRQFIEVILLEQLERNIVIFIDEIDSVLSLNFPTDDFFAFIRGCYNSRADNQVYNRLRICLLGVATPSALIEDGWRTPFNIGHSIELTGFTLAEAQPLVSGLQEKVAAPEKVLAEILDWTRGQPFLTQKLCHLIASNNLSPQPDVGKLVHTHIIENWEYQDEPEHLRTIRDRILNNQKQVGKLLEIYQKILQQETIDADDSPGVTQLKLSGLVVKLGHKLSIYNPIYRAVFNQDWVNRKLAALRPYADKLSAWLDSDCTDDSQLLDKQDLRDAQVWAADKSLADRDYQFLTASLDLECKQAEHEAERILSTAKKQAERQQIIGILCSLGALIIGSWATSQIFDLRQQKYVDLQQRISIGENILLNPNLDKRAGAKQFALGNFSKAAQSFHRSHQDLPQDPETVIYENNARFANHNPLTIAVSVPIGKNQAVAQQVLRGVAQAQQEANQGCQREIISDSCGIQGRPLQIKIVNDDNDPETAQELANLLLKDLSVVAVVGHNASDVSRAAAKVYQGRLVMISPTSSALDFREIQPSPENYIFRTVPGIRYIVQSLVQHIVQDIEQPKILICHDSEADGNISFKKEFSNFHQQIELVDLDCDFSNPNLDYNQIIKQAIEQKVNSLLLAPHVDRINEAIKIAKVNYEQPSESKLRLFSSTSLYTSQTLESEEGQEAVMGMQLAVAWYPDIKIDSDSNQAVQKFAQEARKLWHSNLNYRIVTWRTAMSYDATRAIIKGLKKKQSRKGLQKNLSQPEFLVHGATGLVKFKDGERMEAKALLVEVQQVNDSQIIADFVPLVN